MKLGPTINAAVAIALLAGCTPSARAQSWDQAIAPRLESQAPTAATDEKLMYVVENPYSVLVYSYPGERLKSTLNGFGFPVSACADNHGNVFIVDYAKAEIFEYAPGASVPLAIFSDKGYSPSGCSIDPTTGNLAVANEYADNYTTGTFAIYSRSNTRPIETLEDPDIYRPRYCGYDAKGNLYANGYAKNLDSEFAVLPAGSTSFQSVALNVSIGEPGSVQWDGTYVAVGDASLNVIYQFEIAGSSGTEVHSTTLDGITDAEQFWIEGGKTAAVNPDYNRVGIWNYPAGGEPIKSITQNGYIPLGVTVSSPVR
jgi:hypothetical protein